MSRSALIVIDVQDDYLRVRATIVHQCIRP